MTEMIYHRKSCRSFTGTPMDAATLDTIRFFRSEVPSPAGYGYIGSVTL